MNFLDKKKIKDFLKQYYKNCDGNWIKDNYPTSGYGMIVNNIPSETNEILDFLENLSK